MQRSEGASNAQNHWPFSKRPLLDSLLADRPGAERPPGFQLPPRGVVNMVALGYLQS